jgi:23S rRNA pseudouridine1911/1915/1917 synthase
MRKSTRSFLVGEVEAGSRLDRYLCGALWASRSQVRKLLAGGGVKVNDRVVGPSDKGVPVTAGSRIEVTRFRPPASQRPIPQPEAPLQILARGDGWIAVEKFAGTPVHPLAEEERGTLLNALIARSPEILGVGEAGLRSGVVHRLDVETSGALLFATREDRWRELREAFRRHRVHKRYRAIASGELGGEGELVLYLGVTRHRPARVRVRSAEAPGSRRTALHWRALESGGGATLVEVEPVTGFLHQIRVALAHLGHPLLGDAVYGIGGGPEAPRQMLHAAAIGYREIEVGSPDPPDFREALARLGLSGRAGSPRTPRGEPSDDDSSQINP